MKAEDYFLFSFVLVLVCVGTFWVFLPYRGEVELGAYWDPDTGFYFPITVNVSIIFGIIRHLCMWLAVGFFSSGVIKIVLPRLKKQ